MPSAQEPSRQDLIDFVETSAIGLHWVSADGTILWANPADYEPLGYTANEYIGQHIAKFHVHAPTIDDILRRLTQGERLQNYEAELLCKSGETRKVLITSSVRHDEQGGFLHTRCFTVDVSDRRGASVELQVEALNREVERLRLLASRERGLLHAILRQSPHGIIVADATGKLVLQNEASERIWRGSATAHDVEGWGQYRAFHPDGRPYVAEDWSMARALRSGEVTEAEEIRFQRFDDSLGTLVGSSAPIYGADGQLEGALSIFTDISGLKEQQLEATREAQRRAFIGEVSAVLASSLDYAQTLKQVARLTVPTMADWCAVDLIAHDGTLTRVASAHINVNEPSVDASVDLAAPLGTDGTGIHQAIRSRQAILHDSVSAEVLAALARGAEQLAALQGLGAGSAMIVPLHCRERTLGAMTFVRAKAGPPLSQVEVAMGEQLARVAALSIDNAKLYEAAHASSVAKDTFLATVSHELRTPLNAILGWSNLLASTELTPQKREHAVSTIARNARLQAKLIEDLLDVSRIVSGKLHLDRRQIDLCEVVSAAVDSVRTVADAKRVQLETFLPEGDCQTFGDAGRLQQVVWNLLSNAIKFTPEGGEVWVKLDMHDGWARLRVRDTGMGIEPAELSQVFERFKQLDPTTTRAQGGLGLGLAIVKQLLDMHGGSVSAASKGRGTGSEFSVRLPLVAHAVPSRLRSSEPAIAPMSVQGLRVLVVDDEPDTRQVLAEILETHGAIVTMATSASEAFAAIERDPPDVLLSDIGMPNEDGYSLIRRVRAAQRSSDRPLPAAALTAFARADDRSRAMLAGFQTHVSKPIEPAELLMVVAALAGRSSVP